MQIYNIKKTPVFRLACAKKSYTNNTLAVPAGNGLSSSSSNLRPLGTLNSNLNFIQKIQNSKNNTTTADPGPPPPPTLYVPKITEKLAQKDVLSTLREYLSQGLSESLFDALDLTLGLAVENRFLHTARIEKDEWDECAAGDKGFLKKVELKAEQILRDSGVVGVYEKDRKANLRLKEEAKKQLKQNAKSAEPSMSSCSSSGAAAAAVYGPGPSSSSKGGDSSSGSANMKKLKLKKGLKKLNSDEKQQVRSLVEYAKAIREACVKIYERASGRLNHHNGAGSPADSDDFLESNSKKKRQKTIREENGIVTLTVPEPEELANLCDEFPAITESSKRVLLALKSALLGVSRSNQTFQRSANFTGTAGSSSSSANLPIDTDSVLKLPLRDKLNYLNKLKTAGNNNSNTTNFLNSDPETVTAPPASRVILIAGPPGSGKSKICKNLLKSGGESALCFTVYITFHVPEFDDALSSSSNQSQLVVPVEIEFSNSRKFPLVVVGRYRYAREPFIGLDRGLSFPVFSSIYPPEEECASTSNSSSAKKPKRSYRIMQLVLARLFQLFPQGTTFLLEKNELFSFGRKYARKDANRDSDEWDCNDILDTLSEISRGEGLSVNLESEKIGRTPLISAKSDRVLRDWRKRHLEDNSPQAEDLEESADAEDSSSGQENKLKEPANSKSIQFVSRRIFAPFHKLVRRDLFRRQFTEDERLGDQNLQSQLRSVQRNWRAIEDVFDRYNTTSGNDNPEMGWILNDGELKVKKMVQEIRGSLL